LVEDLKLGFGGLVHHHSAFKRIAVVSDKQWSPVLAELGLSAERFTENVEATFESFAICCHTLVR